jgi:hypothetical protein
LLGAVGTPAACDFEDDVCHGKDITKDIENEIAITQVLQCCSVAVLQCCSVAGAYWRWSLIFLAHSRSSGRRISIRLAGDDHLPVEMAALKKIVMLNIPVSVTTG